MINITYYLFILRSFSRLRVHHGLRDNYRCDVSFFLRVLTELRRRALLSLKTSDRKLLAANFKLTTENLWLLENGDAKISRTF